MYYTLGQRKGIGLGGLAGFPEQPWFVLAKDLVHNRLVVGQGEEHPLLLSKALLCRDVHWISDTSPQLPFGVQAKTRYRQADQACTVSVVNHEHFRVDFQEAQRAVTPGQALVFYQGSECLGGATIDVIID
jgi:tRNA-specific 2-thiouridylase